MNKNVVIEKDEKLVIMGAIQDKNEVPMKIEWVKKSDVKDDDYILVGRKING